MTIKVHPDGAIDARPDIKPLAVYVAGPMRGIPDFNFPAFLDAGQRLRVLGHEVGNPAEWDIEGGFEWAGKTGNEDLSAMGFSLRDALGMDLKWITEQADAICLLPGWENSKGARAEHALAVALGLRAGTITDFELSVFGPAETFSPHEGPFSEVRVISSTGGQKGSKPARFDLIPQTPLWQVAELYGRGAAKYAERNWERGYDWSLSFAALQRHAWLFWGGEDTDTETGLPHMASVVFHAFALMEYANTHSEFDNRPEVAA